MENQNNEIWVENKMKFFIDQDTILNVMVFGDIDAKTALAAKHIIQELTFNLTWKPKFLVNLNEAGRQSPEARKTWDEISEEKNAAVALFGMHYVAKVIATFFMKFSRTKNTRFFNTKEDALNWLKEENE